MSDSVLPSVPAERIRWLLFTVDWETESKMPGLCFQYTPRGSSDVDAVDSAGVRRSEHEFHRLQSHEDVTYGYTRYPSYPIHVIEDDSRTLYFEGELYDSDDLATDLRELGGTLLEGDDDELAAWMQRDGEYLFAAVDDRTGEGALLTDPLGRLPTYYRTSGGALVASREIQYVLSAGDTTFDDLAIAQQLLFGYALGDRTLWEEIDRVPPATRLRFGPDGVATDRLHTFDFGTYRHANRSLEENVGELVDRFQTACRDRTDVSRPPVVSLSGGLDSRAVLLGYHGNDLPVRTATFTADDSEIERDAKIAGDIATTLDVDWKLVALPALKRVEAREMISLKAGLNQCNMGSILVFFRELEEAFGSDITYVTGDGGDKAIPDLTPSRSFDSTAELAAFAVEQNRIFSPSEAAAIAAVSVDRLRRSVVERFAEYPEHRFRDRYVHFMIAERGRNWLFEGEDRNRYYFWSTTPFYSLPFFRYAMNVPPEQKSSNDLYEQFLTRLWPRATEFRDAEFDAKPGSTKYALLQRGMALADRFPRLGRLGKRLYKGDSSGSTEGYLEVVREQLRDGGSFESALSTEALRDVAADPKGYDNVELWNLVTVLSTIEVQSGEQSKLERRPNRPIER